jgi:large conductance mechanosensitive channel
MALWREFKAFALKGSVIDLAVAVVIGGAFLKIVNAFVTDLLMPLISWLSPSGDWRKLTVTPLHFAIGDFIGAVVDFTLVALALFLVVVKVVQHFAPTKAPEAPATRSCPECLELIPAAARRCRACTAVLAPVA